MQTEEELDGRAGVSSLLKATQFGEATQSLNLRSAPVSNFCAVTTEVVQCRGSGK